jgi:hypothetical protein
VRDILHLLKVVLDEADMRGVATRDMEADELRAKRKIIGASDRSVLA